MSPIPSDAAAERAVAQEPAAAPTGANGGSSAKPTAKAAPKASAPRADDAVGRELEALTDMLRRHRQRVEVNPHANPVKLLAYDVLKRMQDGELTESCADALVQRLTARAFASRAARMRTYLGEVEADANRGAITRLLAEKLETEGFAAFKETLERVHFGFVMTAHPTFSLNPGLSRDLVALAIGRDLEGRPLGEAEHRAIMERAEASRHKPGDDLSLDAEHAWSLIAIRNLRGALRELYGWVFDLLAESAPERVAEVTPKLVSVATWVGYDTDGRSDIGWNVTVAKRVAVQVDQLRHYLGEVQAIRRAGGAAKADQVLELIEAKLALSVGEMEAVSAALASLKPGEEGFERGVAEVARRLAGDSGRLNDAAKLQALVERALEAASDEAKRGLFVLRSEVATQGLAAARSHLRINTVQLHNAIRKTIDMTHPPDDPSFRMSYMQAVADLIGEVEPRTINYGSLVQERATAPRAFMIVRQILKHLDAAEPVRFLIAETESALTLLAALYYAKLFGVDRQVDISPLFETTKALERGPKLLREALAFPCWREYLRGRGRMCIQAGFSDAGRYIGQPAASYMIERLRLGLSDVLKEHGLQDVTVVVFDTHGESIGRGAHPGSALDRFRYYDTAESRRRFAAAGVRQVQETSFQGGDGYAWFLAPQSALAMLCRAVEHRLTPPVDGDVTRDDDPFYDRPLYTSEFFSAIKQFNDRVIADRRYATLLGAWGTNMLHPSGSRAIKREGAGGAAPKELEHPSQIRAIPHNAILQQLGMLANTIGGVGQAVAKNPDEFQDLYRNSPRFRRLLSMAEHAFKFTDLEVTQAYVELFDPGVWLRRAQVERDDDLAESLSNVADHVERMRLHDRLSGMVRVFARDHNALARALRVHRRLARETGDEPIAIDEATRDDIHLLHALRLALIQALMLEAIRVPDFSDRHNTTPDELISRLMRLEVDWSLGLLKRVFPLTGAPERLDYGEPATYGDGGQSYAAEHATIFEPIERRFELIRRIGSGIVHHLGAFG